MLISIIILILDIIFDIFKGMPFLDYKWFWLLIPGEILIYALIIGLIYYFFMKN